MTPDTSTGSSSLLEVPGGSACGAPVCRRSAGQEPTASTSRCQSTHKPRRTSAPPVASVALLPPGGGERKHAAAEEHLSSSSPSSPPSALDCYLQMERCHFLFWLHLVYFSTGNYFLFGTRWVLGAKHDGTFARKRPL